MSERTFYDIHLHAFNLSHPYLGAFIRRYNLSLLLVFSPLAPIAAFLTRIPGLKRAVINKVNQVRNLLAVMENDLSSVFLLLEDCADFGEIGHRFRSKSATVTVNSATPET